MVHKDARRLKKIVVILAIVISGITGTWFGIGIGINEMTETDIAADSIEKATGEKDTEIYTVEFWPDGVVKVTTYQRYINQISENTLLITDNSSDEVVEDLRIMQDMTEEGGAEVEDDN